MDERTATPASDRKLNDSGRATADVGDARDLALRLLAARAPGATVCPSEIARALAAAAGGATPAIDWRDRMPMVHAAVDRLVGEGAIALSWRGKALSQRAGPYRIGRAAGD